MMVPLCHKSLRLLSFVLSLSFVGSPFHKKEREDRKIIERDHGGKPSRIIIKSTGVLTPKVSGSGFPFYSFLPKLRFSAIELLLIPLFVLF